MKIVCVVFIHFVFAIIDDQSEPMGIDPGCPTRAWCGNDTVIFLVPGLALVSHYYAAWKTTAHIPLVSHGAGVLLNVVLGTFILFLPSELPLPLEPPLRAGHLSSPAQWPV